MFLVFTTIAGTTLIVILILISVLILMLVYCDKWQLRNILLLHRGSETNALLLSPDGTQVEYCDERVCVFLCVFLCPSDLHHIFVYTLLGSILYSSDDVLPVLWMASYLWVMGHRQGSFPVRKRTGTLRIWRARERELILGTGSGAPSGVQGQSEAPLKLKAFYCRREQICHSHLSET